MPHCLLMVLAQCSTLVDITGVALTLTCWIIYHLISHRRLEQILSFLPDRLVIWYSQNNPARMATYHYTNL